MTRVVSSGLRGALRGEAEAARALVMGWRAYADHTRDSALVLHAHGVGHEPVHPRDAGAPGAGAAVFAL